MAIPECSLRAKRTQGLECELASLAGSGVQIRSPLGACPVPQRCSSMRNGGPISGFLGLQLTRRPRALRVRGLPLPGARPRRLNPSPLGRRRRRNSALRLSLRVRTLSIQCTRERASV